MLEAQFDSVDDGSIVPSEVSRWNAHCDVQQAAWQRWPSTCDQDEFDPAWQRRARFHEWLQQRVGDQLAEVAATGVHLIGDLAVGFSPDGADAHAFRDLLALDMRIGAPPDQFNTEGQEWGLPPFVPWKLRAAGYAVRPDGARGVARRARPADRSRDGSVPPVLGAGGFIADRGRTSPFRPRSCSRSCASRPRAGAFVVGEDLGTVEASVRDARRAPHRRHQGAVVRGGSARALARDRARHRDDPRPADRGRGVESGITGDPDDDEVYERLLAVAPFARTAAGAQLRRTRR
ncbi:MAG: 4-alpha-glucanotransferase [Ilumatobacteraceae bacterium]